MAAHCAATAASGSSSAVSKAVRPLQQVVVAAQHPRLVVAAQHPRLMRRRKEASYERDNVVVDRCNTRESSSPTGFVGGVIRT